MATNEPIQTALAIEPESTSDSAPSSDYESIYSDDNASITDTLKTEFKSHVYKHGRRYNAFKEGDWQVPNDEEQQDQMDMFHEIFRMCLDDKLFLAPIPEKPTRILDLGTGTGIWAMHIADMYPSAVVTGNDLSPIQPTWVPPNLNFEVDDFNAPFTYTPDSFDYIHGRSLHMAVNDWTKFTSECYKTLKPGGWLEICSEIPEFLSDDNTVPEKCPMKDWTEKTYQVAEMIRKPIRPDLLLKDAMSEAGFDMTTYKQEWFKIPLGTWPKDKKLKKMGALNLVHMLTGLEGWMLVCYKQVLGFTQEATDEARRGVERDFKNKKYHSYFRFQVTYAQKPLES